TAARERMMTWLWQKLGLQAGSTLFDVACGPGLYAVPFAQRGVHVTGVDFGPAAIAYARELAQKEGVDERTTFHEQDMRTMDFAGAGFDAAMLIYGQLAVMTREEAQTVLTSISDALKLGGKLCIELLDKKQVDKKKSSWWYTDDTGLWGDAPYLHLGERFWHEADAVSVERFHILHLETGKMDEVQLCDQTYEVDEMVAMMKAAGFTAVDVYPAWDTVEFYDEDEWIVYVATKSPIVHP
ncbi:MAG: class I SAM-dependent methyltransferase, partial [Chloroflexi bacterium]|nr:class I SAM-dependent methyltransferase [Chloroflexota bacterium]